MDGDQIMQQESQEEQVDSFLEGWNETSSEPEEGASAEDGGDQAEPQAEGQESGGDQAEPQAEGQESGGDQVGPQDTPSGDNPDGGDQPAGEPAGQQDGGNQPAQPPRTWTLNHMGQPVVISEADVPVLAQKGLDYDRIRAVYDEARPVMDLFRDFARQAGISVQEYVGLLRTQAKEAQGLDREAARRAVELEDREARVNAQETVDRARKEAARRAQAAQAQRQERINADIQEFLAVFPNAARDFKNIPQEVWDAVNGGMSLVAAYARYSNAQAAQRAQAQEDERQRLDAIQQQADRNAAASTGSMKSAGQNHGPKDPFLEGWDDD